MYRPIELIRMIFCAILLHFGAAAAASPAEGYSYYSVGDVSAPTKGKTEFGLLLMGGGGWDDNAFRWFLERAAHGHILVLSASAGPDTGESIYRDGGAASVETLVFTDRKASSDPKVLEALARADGIFIGGGDQSNYVRYWKGTPVERALNAHVARGRPIGGTSAGLAILGAASYGAMDGGSVDSVTALADPAGPAVTIVRDFLDMPYLRHVITDSHFTARDRIGRLIAFVAQVRAGGDPKAVGIGVDEKSALCVDARGNGRLFTSGEGHAWLIEPRGTAKLLPGEPLGYPNVRVTGIGPESRIDLQTMRVTNPAFVGTATVAAGRLTGVPVPPGASWSLAVHGGAGVVERSAMGSDDEAAYRKGLDEALRAGGDILKRGGSSVDAVEAAVRALEDNPLFNAGKGAVFDSEGANALDAAIMNGASLKAGAVAGVTRTRNPVSLARAVMERSPHVLLAGAGADRFSTEQGLEQVDPSYFRTERRWREYLDWNKSQHASAPQRHFGTVGAVARDMRGHLAAATSTGGLTGKRWGRVGDSPLIGAGTYAQPDCAVSATGTGEFFMRTVAAHQVCARFSWNKESIDAAAKNVVDEIADMGGLGAIMAMDGNGQVAFPMNSDGMYRGIITSTSPARTAIYADEKSIIP